MPGIPNFLLERTVDPLYEPVTLEMAKRQCNLELAEDYHDRWFDSSQADSVGAISAARTYVENATLLAFMKQTYILRLRSTDQLNPLTQTNNWDLFNWTPSELPNTYKAPWTDLRIHPVQTISSIAYTDSAGSAQVLDVTDFDLVRSKHRSLLVPKSGIVLPITSNNVTFPVTITMVCGYSTNATEATQRAAVPTTARMAILALLSHWFKNREAVLVGTVSKEIEHGMTALLNQLRPLRYV